MDYHVGKTCPYCQYPIKHSVNVVICQLCKIPHHQDCWDENLGCTTYGCQGLAGISRAGSGAEPGGEQQDQEEWVDVELRADRGYRPEPAREGIAGRLILIAAMIIAAVALYLIFYEHQIPVGTSSHTTGSGGGSGVIRVPVDFATIQEAIDSAVDGQEIVVAEGVYSERINFRGKNIVLRSLNPGNLAVVQNTVIDGGFGGTTVTFENGEGSSAVLNGFTITGGSGTRKQYSVTSYDGSTLNFTRIYGGGVLVAGGSSPTITNNIISGNSVNNAGAGVLGVGGGIAVLDGSAPLIEDNTIITNSAGAYGGGILIWYRASPTLSGNLIEANWAGDIGGGIMMALMSNPTISGNEILRNRAENWGGGLYIAHMSDTSVIGNEIRQNEAGRGGGIFIRRTDSSLIFDNNIMHNKASGNGGGIYLDNRATATVEQNRVEINEAASGGAIWVDSDSEVRLGSPDSNSYQGNKPNNVVRR